MSDALAANVVAFGRLLRAAGVSVTPEQSRHFAQSLALLGVESRRDVKAAGRTIFVRHKAELAVYDAAFERFWRRGTAVGHPAERLPRIQSRARAAEPGVPRGEAADGGAEWTELPSGRSASSAERLRRIDFAELTPQEARDAGALVAALAPALPLRPSRRHSLHRSGEKLAPRAMLRRSLATGGEVLDWRWSRKRRRPRPLVLVCDISGSMETYSRFLLRFAHALGRAGAPVEAFVFGTRLTRITRELRPRNADQALRGVAAKVVDWSGGTRIGASLRELNQRWVRRTVRSGAIVLIVSDGWERGDPALLGREMATLRRSCHRLIWLDPLAGQPGFEPVTRGLVAALPHVDHLLPCGTLGSLEALGRRLRRLIERPAPGPPFRPASPSSPVR
jgi:uncharacterized protein with von Willebrand factor type A (vWA) domain